MSGTNYIASNWRIPENSNSSKNDNYSLSYDGAEYITINSSTQLDETPLNPYSISFWIKTTNSTSSRVISEKRATSTFTNAQYTVHIQSGSIYWYGGAGGNGSPLSTSSPINDGEWHHIVLVAESITSSKMYVDGQLDGTSSGNRINSSSVAGTFNIGSNYAGSFIFIGDLSEYSIFDYALTLDQVNTLYGDATSGSGNPMSLKPTPVAYYPLGDNSSGDPVIQPNVSVDDASVFEFIPTSTQAIDIWSGVPANAPSAFTIGASESYTISCWVKSNVAVSPETILTVRKNVSGSVYNKLMLTYNAGTDSYRARMDLRDDNNTTALETSDATNLVVRNQWNHVAVVIDRTATKLYVYVNGVVTGTGTDISSIGAFTDITDVAIGYDTFSGGRFYFDGQMSNLAIFKQALNQTQIDSIYNDGMPSDISSLNPAAWYKLDQSANWEADTSGNWQIPDAVSAYPQSFSFNGSSQYIPIGTTSLGITSAITVSAWVKIPTTNTGGPSPNIQIIAAEDKTGGTNRNWSLFWRHQSVSDKYFRFQVWHTDGSASFIESTGIVPNDGNWHHVMGTFDGTTDANGLKLYVDDTLFQTTAGSTGIRSVSTVSPSIGANETGSAWRFEGNLSNIAVWDSVQNINDIYNSGTPVISYGVVPTAWWKLDDTATFSTNWTITDASGNGNDGISSGMTEQSLVNNNVSTLNGESSGMTSGNLVLSDLTRNLPYENYSMLFDGITEYIDLGTSSTLEFVDDFTVSVWIKETGALNRGVFCCGDRSGTSGWMIYRTSANKVAFSVYTANNRIATSTTSINTGDWFNVIGTFEKNGTANQQVKIYVNGSFEGQNGWASPQTPAYPGTIYKQIAFPYAGSNEFLGNISNVVAWNTLLSSTEIQKIYANGIPQDLTSFTPQPVSWWTLGKQSFWNGADWITKDMIGSDDGTSSGMAVSDLVGDAPRSEANGTGTNMDIPTNLVGNAGFSDKNAYSINMSPSARVTDTP